MCALYDGAGELRTQFFRAIAEVCLGGAYVRRIGHRVFTSFRKPEHGVGQLFLFSV